MDYFEGKTPESEYSLQRVPGEGLLAFGKINDSVTNNGAIARFCEIMVALNCSKISVHQDGLDFNVKFNELPNQMGGKKKDVTCKITTSDDLHYEGEYNSQIVWAMSMMKSLIENVDADREFLKHIGVYDIAAEAFDMEFDEFVDKCKDAKKVLEKEGSLEVNSNFEIKPHKMNR